MEFRYTEEQELLRRTVGDFARKEIAPGAEERDRTGRFDYDLYRRLGQMGIIGMRRLCRSDPRRHRLHG